MNKIMFNIKKVKRLEEENEELREALSKSYIRNKRGQFEKYQK